MAKMYIKEIYKGLNYHNFPKCTAVENKMGYDEMVVEPKCNVQSNCEHHGVVISGYASVAYIPNKRVIGLSKINRIVEFFSKRPQIQERLTEQIFHALCYILDTDNVAVVVNAEHYCVKSRGVEDVGAYTVTSKLGGVFRTDASVRQEFLALSRQG
jgi:GTP cyclohydrolase I